MPLPISDYQNPRFRRIPEGATMSRNDNAVFDAVQYGVDIRGWRMQPQPGYNAQYPSTSPIRINLNNWNLSLPPGAK